MAADQNESDDPIWRQLEVEVAGIYRSMGYDVLEDTLISGNQVDVLAERLLPGGGPARLAVEVKHCTGRSLPIKEVNEFLLVARNLLAEGSITGAALVTDALITPKSRLATNNDD